MSNFDLTSCKSRTYSIIAYAEIGNRSYGMSIFEMITW